MLGQIKIKSKALKYEKDVNEGNESENVTGLVYLYQLLITVCIIWKSR